jgi:hypothetical protein
MGNIFQSAFETAFKVWNDKFSFNKIPLYFFSLMLCSAIFILSILVIAPLCLLVYATTID